MTQIDLCRRLTACTQYPAQSKQTENDYNAAKINHRSNTSENQIDVAVRPVKIEHYYDEQ